MEWLKLRLKERTSMDGGVIIAGSLAIILFGGIFASRKVFFVGYLINFLIFRFFPTTYGAANLYNSILLYLLFLFPSSCK